MCRHSFTLIVALVVTTGCPPPSTCEIEAWYPDADGDDHGALGAEPYNACEANLPPGGWSLTADDCDESNATAYAGAEEICDVDIEGLPIDNDCDGEANEGCTQCIDGSDCAHLDNGDVCDGGYNCVNEFCVTGTALTCVDSNPATNDSCVATSGCAYLGFTGMNDTTVRGNPLGGTHYPDVCPAGQVMIGFAGETGASFDKLQVVCGVPTVGGNLAVTTTAGATLPPRGNNAGTPVSASCPSNELVAGFAGRAGALIDQLALRCAAITATYANGTYTPTRGTLTTGQSYGGSGGVAFPDTDCADGEVAIGANIRAGDSIDGFGLICGVVTITQ